MDQVDRVTAQFGASRARLRAIAYRMLGSRTEAEDAVQEDVAPTRPGRPDPRRQPRRVAHHGHGARVPGSAAIASRPA